MMEEYEKIKKKMRFLDKKIIENEKKKILEYITVEQSVDSKFLNLKN